ncbi:tol-pal system protein YbgF [candidate division KSB1 bacterium]|nr:tol-pal system protein YbgF [candidate division KSB1 bacterium]NIR72657.1 tol-pal system protein YbgF [candidate division KSB1 bacterium]NIS23687.1 tol-pal system protein YbgF [candidate division KSB1 bacterium]NIT70607.1 tol-pal system protein YbgF [candidate division KSB1 bacterium]NIU24335.1 tol-pal system protein YbgF [candidate division KSB1 bacterium]
MKTKKPKPGRHFIPYLPLILILLSIGLIGCAASKKRISTHETEIDNLRRELRFLKEDNSQLQRKIDNLEKRLSEQDLAIRQNKADLTSQMVEVSDQLEEVQNQLNDVNYRITALIERKGNLGALPSTPPQTSQPNVPPSQPDTLSSQPQPSTSFGLDESREIYNTAYRDVLRGNYQLALEGFRRFLQQYPNSDLSDNAQYWLGEVYYAQGRYVKAIEEFEKMVKWYRGSDKVSAALLKIGYSYINIDELDQGKLYLEEVINEYPDSQEANLARGRLAALK